MSLARRFFALFAAYAVALQLFLLPLQISAAAGLSGPQCASEAPTQQHRNEDCPCCAGVCVSSCQHQALAASPSPAAEEPTRAWTSYRPIFGSVESAAPPADFYVWARGPPRVERA